MTKILFIGGTGLISNACTRYAAKNGLDLTVLNRGESGRYPMPSGVQVLHGDVHDRKALTSLLHGQNFDVVVDWIGFEPADVEQNLQLFNGRVGQFVFISSASVYQKPPRHYLVGEDTPLENPYNNYSRNKIACENALWDAMINHGFPVTIVRPSSTYGQGQVPVLLNSWQAPYTIVDRIRKGKPIIIPGDGTSLWVPTWNEDFAAGFMPLLGDERAIGQAYHITSDEVLAWDQVYDQLADAAGVSLNGVHIAADFIVEILPDEKGSLHGDRSHSMVFDNRKIKQIVPGFACSVSWAEGMRRCVAWFDAENSRRQVDEGHNSRIEAVLARYTRA